MATIDDFSVGGVVVTDTGLIVIVTTTSASGQQLVGLPKGHPDPGESPIETAIREVREETGLDTVVDNDLPPQEIEYWFSAANGDDVHKRVQFYRLSVTGGDTHNHDDEVDEVLVLSYDQALATLTYESERAVVRALCG